MTRTATLLMAVVLVVGSVSAFPMAAAAQSGPSVASAIVGPAHAQVDANATENASNVTPGERLTAVVGVGQAEFEGEIELRSYGIEYALAATNDSRADVVGERLVTIEQRLAELERERDELEAARENGSIGEGEYRARVTELSARTETVEQLADASEARAGELPAELLESKGINVTAIQTLRQNAENLTGPQVAEIARSIAGDDVGGAISRGPPEDVGGPVDGVPSPDDRGEGDAQAAVDRAAQRVDAAEARLEQAEQRVGENASENATEALARARAELESARSAVENARAALDAGDDDEAASLAEDALDHAEQAESHAQDAVEAAERDGPADGEGDGAGAGTSGGNSGGTGSGDY